MKYYFYRTVNLENGKYYYGVRHSKDPEKDSHYLGSGLILKEAIRVHGKKNFRKEILKYFPTMEKAYEYEAKIVTEQLVSDPMCYNVKLGGSGGFSGTTVIHKGTQHRRICKVSLPKYLELGWEKGFSKEAIEARKKAKQGYTHSEETRKKIGLRSRERRHSLETRKRMSLSHRGNLSTSGMIWVTNEFEDKHIFPTDLELWESKGYRRGRRKSSVQGFLAHNEKIRKTH